MVGFTQGRAIIHTLQRQTADKVDHSETQVVSLRYASTLRSVNA